VRSDAISLLNAEIAPSMRRFNSLRSIPSLIS
jgi:hypothetical protein